LEIANYETQRITLCLIKTYKNQNNSIKISKKLAAAYFDDVVAKKLTRIEKAKMQILAEKHSFLGQPPKVDQTYALRGFKIYFFKI
jgi:hypothetical protein